MIAATAFSHAALAQDGGSYEAKGLPMGAFTAFPKVTATVEHNDNIYAQARNEVDDVIWRVQPEVTLESDWSRHSLSAFAKASFNRNKDFKNENSDEYSFGADGRLDVLRTTRLFGGANYTDATEPRTSPNAVGAATEPTEYNVVNAYIGGEHEFNRLMVSSRLDYGKFDYQDVRALAGPVLDQDYRDHDVTALMGRADYSISPDTSLFVEIAGNQRKYDRVRPAVALTRDSDGVTVLAGAKFDLTAVAKGEVSAGYMTQSFDDVTQDDIKGLAVRTSVQWFPTRLTTVTFIAARGIQDSAVPNAAALVAESVDLRIDHDLLRNVRLTGEAGYGRDTYKDINRRDRRVTAGAGVTYLLNRNIGLSLAYKYLDREIERGVGIPYKVNKVQAGLTLQF